MSYVNFRHDCYVWTDLNLMHAQFQQVYRKFFCTHYIRTIILLHTNLLNYPTFSPFQSAWYVNVCGCRGVGWETHVDVLIENNRLVEVSSSCRWLLNCTAHLAETLAEILLQMMNEYKQKSAFFTHRFPNVCSLAHKYHAIMESVSYITLWPHCVLVCSRLSHWSISLAFSKASRPTA
jgi:hypothetical protein